MLGFKLGRPSIWVIKDFLTSNTDISQKNIERIKRLDYELIGKTDLELSCAYRKYLRACIDSSSFKEEEKWVEQQFVRIDERLAKLKPGQDELIMQFKLRMLYELNIRTNNRKPRGGKK